MVRDTGIYLEGFRPLMRTLSKMESSVSEEVRSSSITLADRFLELLRSNVSTAPQAKMIGAFKAYRDRVPKIGFSARKNIGMSGGGKIGDVFFGFEFGGGARPTTRQFGLAGAQYGGGEGRWFYPTLRRHGAELAGEWFDRIADLLGDEWNAGARAALTEEV